MPGFVDVSNMTSEEVRRMGHADDYDEPEKYQPRRTRQSTWTAPVANHPSYSVSDVWAAACAAQRINGSYIKEPVMVYNESIQDNTVIKRRNRDIMMEFLQHPDQLLVDDVEAGEECRNYLQHDLTFRTLKGKTGEFDTAVRKTLAVQDRFDSYLHKYELAIVACLPASAERSKQRQTSDSRIKFAQGGLIGNVNDKVTVNVEVVSAVLSKQYNIYWIRAVTDADQPVFFSSKESHDVGARLTVKGTVKAHKENLTQLNRVKVI